MIPATTDTNVIVAGLSFPGKPRHILEEMADVLQRKKFGWSPAEVAEAVDRILRVAEQVQPQQTDDNRILECNDPETSRFFRDDAHQRYSLS